MVFCQRGGGLECPHSFGTPAGRRPRKGEALAHNLRRNAIGRGTLTGRRFMTYPRRFGLPAAMSESPTPGRIDGKIGLGHRHRWLCRAGDRRLALRAVRREHHIRPPSVRRNQKRAQRGRASSIKAPAQGKRSDNAAAWPEVMTTQIIAIRGRLTRRRLAYSIQSAQSQLIDFRHF